MSDQPRDQPAEEGLDDEGCYLCENDDDTICDSCSRPICWDHQAEDSTDCVECAI